MMALTGQQTAKDHAGATERAVAAFLDGRLIHVPDDLVSHVHELLSPSGRRYRRDRVEGSYLVWWVVKNAGFKNRKASDPWRRVHHTKFRVACSSSTFGDIREDLRSGEFLEYRRSYSAGRESMKYKAKCNGRPVPIELEYKTINEALSKFTERELNCQYARQNLKLLECDQDGLRNHLSELLPRFAEDQRTRAAGRALAARKAVTTMPDKRQAMAYARRAETWEQREYDREDSGFVYRLAKPLLELVTKKGTVKRGSINRRLMSPFTNLKKEFREHFKINGEQLVCLDMVACQPCLLGHVANDPEFVKDCISDAFYLDLARLLGITRKKAKGVYCEFAYGPIRSERTGARQALEVQKYMAAKYPVAFGYMKDRKTHNFRRFAREMQRLEAEIFIDGVYSQMRTARIPGLSVHDSIFCTATEAGAVQKMMTKELSRRRIRGTISREGGAAEEYMISVRRRGHRTGVIPVVAAKAIS